MRKRIAVASIPTIGFLIAIVFHSAVNLLGQTNPAASRASGNAGVLLVDTDDSCRLLLDGQDQGVVKPDETKKINVKRGEHILKCTVEGIPDLIWRKVIEVKNSEQVAALISLKAQHEAATAKEREAEKSNSIAPDGTADERQNASSRPEAESSTAKDTTAENVCPPRAQTMPPIKFKDLEEVANSKTIVNSTPLDVRVDFVRCAGGFVLVPVTVQIKNRDVTFMNRSGMLYGTVNLFGRVSTETGEVVQVFEDTLQISVPAETLPTILENSGVYWKALSLRPGRYRLEIAVKDVNGDGIGLFRQGIPVPEFSGDKLTASSLILADQIEVVPAGEVRKIAFVIGQTKVRPKVASADGQPALFKRSQKVNFWMQVYNLGLDGKTHRASATVEFNLTDLATNKAVVHAAEAMDSASEQLTLQKMVSAAKLDPGRYQMEIKVTDNVSKQSLVRSTVFAVEQSAPAASPSSEQGSSGSESSAPTVATPYESPHEPPLQFETVAFFVAEHRNEEVAALVQKYGVHFGLAGPGADLLRDLGASKDLIDMLRSTSPKSGNRAIQEDLQQLASEENEIRSLLNGDLGNPALHVLLGLLIEDQTPCMAPQADRSNCLRTEPRTAGMIAEFRKAVQLKPNASYTHFYLAASFGDAPDKRQETIAELQEAIRLKPSEPIYHFWLAMRYSIANDKSAAERENAEGYRLKQLEAQPPTRADERGNNSDTARGVSVISVAKGSFFEEIGVQPGTILFQLNKQDIFSSEQLQTLFSRLSPGNDVVFLARLNPKAGTVFLAGTLPTTGSPASIFSSGIAFQALPRSVGAEPQQPPLKGSLTWVSDSAHYPDMEFRAFCVAEPGNTQPFAWQVQMRNTRSWPIHYRYADWPETAMRPDEITYLPLVPTEKCAKPPEVGLHAWKQGEDVGHLVNFKDGKVSAKEYHAGDNRSTHGWMDTVGALAAGVTAAYGGTPVPAATSTEPHDGNSVDVPDAQTGQGLQLHDTCLVRDPRPWNPHTAGTVAELYMWNTCNIGLTVSFCFKEPDAACWKCDGFIVHPGESNTPVSLPPGCRTTNCSELQIVYHAVSEGSPPKPNVDDSCVGAVH